MQPGEKESWLMVWAGGFFFGFFVGYMTHKTAVMVADWLTKKSDK